MAPNSFFLCRIIGNDLPPRHAPGQSRANVEFILRHEPELPGCEKFWLVNRIVDAAERNAVIDLLEEHGQSYRCIPFEMGECGRIEDDLSCLSRPDFELSPAYKTLDRAAKSQADAAIRRLKNLYAMNINGARNLALAIGKSRATWVLPWDGNCFLTADAWASLRNAVLGSPVPYFIVPMARVSANADLLRQGYAPPAVDEPQIVFRADTREVFDERYPYGRADKVELLWRLGVPGVWDERYGGPGSTDLPRPGLCVQAGQFATAGWVARLSSGRLELDSGEDGQIRRHRARFQAIIRFLDSLDVAAIAQRLAPNALTFYDERKLAALAAARDGSAKLPRYATLASLLRASADTALRRGPYSVMHKTSLPPSGMRNDYWAPAAYWWPNPETEDGLPYVRRDGDRVPGTNLFEPGSEQYDRSRAQLLFDDTTVLALAWRVFEHAEYANHAARLIRTWFLQPDTRMTPHLQYADLRRGHKRETESGIIGFKDLYFFLDAVRLVCRSKHLSQAEEEDFREWLRRYTEWLDTSEQARLARLRLNNHGTMYDLQRGCIAAYLDDASMLRSILRRARRRLITQLTADGAQHFEVARGDDRHCCAFNLQGWTALARLAASVGNDLWSFSAPDGRGIGLALSWFVRSAGEESWPQASARPFAMDRLAPLLADYRAHFAAEFGRVPAKSSEHPAVLHPDFGVAPYWELART
jgi:hypothetical protein